ncbi:hypothetical protein LVJ94_05105 [Pendulispora rubella]|uniref:Uncharacterized protein n=1 Tax=Pendulispora rubella TaxID=2741070 RepID=A0ABZ2L6Q4_9BACT
MKRSSSVTAHIHVARALPPRRNAGAMRPSSFALRRAPVVLNPQYVAASAVVR